MSIIFPDADWLDRHYQTPRGPSIAQQLGLPPTAGYEEVDAELGARIARGKAQREEAEFEQEEQRQRRLDEIAAMTDEEYFRVFGWALAAGDEANDLARDRAMIYPD